MTYGPNGMSRARLADLQAAAGIYQMSPREAADTIERCTEVVRTDFEPMCGDIGVTGATRELLWERGLANQSIFYLSV